MASTSSSSSSHTSNTVGTTNISGLETNQPLIESDTVNESKANTSAALSTPLLVGVVFASVIIFVAVLYVIHSRRRRYKPKLFSPSNISAFHGVATSTALGNSSNTLEVSTVSTGIASPHPSLLQTFRLPPISTNEAAEDEIVIDIQDVRDTELPLERRTQASRTTSLISGRSVFSVSIFGSLPRISAFIPVRTSRNSRVSATDSSATTSTVPIASCANEVSSRKPDDAWRYRSETCWSIDPGSDSEVENEQLTSSRFPAGTFVLNRNRLSTLSDDMDEEDTQMSLDMNSLDDSSRRRDLVSKLRDDSSPLRERDISTFYHSSFRRVRGLSALERRRNANSVADITNESESSFFSVDSDLNSILFDDSDSESDSDSDDSVREEEF